MESLNMTNNKIPLNLANRNNSDVVEISYEGAVWSLIFWSVVQVFIMVYAVYKCYHEIDKTHENKVKHRRMLNQAYDDEQRNAADAADAVQRTSEADLLQDVTSSLQQAMLTGMVVDTNNKKTN